MSSKPVVVRLTEAEHRELAALLLHYSARIDRWATSPGLRLAVAAAVGEGK